MSVMSGDIHRADRQGLQPYSEAVSQNMEQEQSAEKESWGLRLGSDNRSTLGGVSTKGCTALAGHHNCGHGPQRLELPAYS